MGRPHTKTIKSHGRQHEASRAKPPFEELHSSALGQPELSDLAENPIVRDQATDFLNHYDIPTIFERHSVTDHSLNENIGQNAGESYRDATSFPVPPQASEPLNLQPFNLSFAQGLDSTSLLPATTALAGNGNRPLTASENHPGFDAALSWSGPGFNQTQIDHHSAPTFPTDQAARHGRTEHSSRPAPNFSQPVVPGSMDFGFVTESSEAGQQKCSDHYEPPVAFMVEPDIYQGQVNPPSALASQKDQAFMSRTLSPKSNASVNRALTKRSSGSEVTTGPQVTESMTVLEQRMRSALPMLIFGGHKRRCRPGRPVPPESSQSSALETDDRFVEDADGRFVEVDKYDVYSSDPFHWSEEFVLFALTSSKSIDHEVPMPRRDVRLPACKKLRYFILGFHVNGYNLLLCTDKMAMDHCGIPEPADQQALGEYIVRFRRRSPGYQSYCYEKGYPVNLSAEKLINTAEMTKDVIEQQFGDFMREAEGVMKQVQVKTGTVYVAHSPLGSIEITRNVGMRKYRRL